MSDKKMKSLTLRVPADVHKAARIKAIEAELSLNKIVANVLRDWVNTPLDNKASKSPRNPS